MFKNAIPSRVYVMPGPNKTIKIGRSKDPLKRARALTGFAGGPVAVLFQTDVRDDACCVEAEALKLMNRHRRYQDEWFVAKPGQAIAAIKEAIVRTEQLSAAMEERARRRPRAKVWTIVSQTRWPQIYTRGSSALTHQLVFEF